MAEYRAITELVFWYAELSSQSNKYGFDKIIVVSGFASNIRQLLLPTQEYWWIIEGLLSFLFGNTRLLENFQRNQIKKLIKIHRTSQKCCANLDES